MFTSHRVPMTMVGGWAPTVPLRNTAHLAFSLDLVVKNYDD